jgi:3-hydroxyisobutyrate dehydrogenase
MIMEIGYVGLGNMGGALARRLQLSHPLTVFDLSATAIQEMVACGATAASSLGHLAAKCDVILLCLPTSAHVRSVIFSETGLIGQLRPDTLIIDQTTGDPNMTREMASELAAKGMVLIDAPVSGGRTGAAAGTIAIMVGAAAEHYSRCHQLLAAISPNIFHAGDVGAGHAAKLVNNMLSGAQRLLTFEALALAEKSGIKPETACAIRSAGGARNAFLERSMGSVIQGRLGVGFTLALMHKDVRLACQLGSDLGVPMLFGNLTREVYQMCISEMGQNADVNTAALMIDRLAGSHVVPPGASST